MAFREGGENAEVAVSVVRRRGRESFIVGMFSCALAKVGREQTMVVDT
jgi:hypothetical protein